MVQIACIYSCAKHDSQPEPPIPKSQQAQHKEKAAGHVASAPGDGTNAAAGSTSDSHKASEGQRSAKRASSNMPCDAEANEELCKPAQTPKADKAHNKKSMAGTMHSYFKPKMPATVTDQAGAVHIPLGMESQHADGEVQTPDCRSGPKSSQSSLAAQSSGAKPSHVSYGPKPHTTSASNADVATICDGTSRDNHWSQERGRWATSPRERREEDQKRPREGQAGNTLDFLMH